MPVDGHEAGWPLIAAAGDEMAVLQVGEDGAGALGAPPPAVLRGALRRREQTMFTGKSAKAVVVAKVGRHLADAVQFERRQPERFLAGAGTRVARQKP